MTSDKANHRFLLSELIRRDFIKKYKRTTFGILWSALSPLFLLLTMDVVFGTFFGRMGWKVTHREHGEAE